VDEDVIDPAGGHFLPHPHRTPSLRLIPVDRGTRSGREAGTTTTQPAPKPRCCPPKRPRHQPKPRRRPCRRGRPPNEPRRRHPSQPSRSLCCSPAVMYSFMQARDIASARLLYERAADAGNGRAALRVGESFDPAFLGRIGVYRNTGDRRLALSWYRRARDLGDTEAAQLLERLESR
jgi:hypothetical protein